MNLLSVKKQMRMQEWSKLIEASQGAGVSIRQWCRQNNVQESQYYYYLRKLRLAACEALPQDMQDGSQSQFALVPKFESCSNSTNTHTSGIKITFPNAVIEIDEGASEVQVKLALEVLLNAQ